MVPAVDAGSVVPGRLSLVVPVFNEVEGIEVLWSTMSAAAERAVAATRLADWEAILVDDGSTDGSAEAIDALVRADGRCRTVRHPTNTGLGAALRSGLDASSGEVIVYTDADLPFDLDHLARLLAPVLQDDADLVSGKRIGRAREGWWRAVQSLAYNALIRVAFRLHVSDVNFACKVANCRALPDPLISDSGFADVEWLVRAARSGCRLVQLPAEFTPRTSGRSTLGGIGTVPAIVRDLLAFRRSSLRTRSRTEPSLRAP